MESTVSNTGLQMLFGSAAVGHRYLRGTEYLGTLTGTQVVKYCTATKALTALEGKMGNTK